MIAPRTLAALAVPVVLALGACSEGARDRAVDDAVNQAKDRASSEIEKQLPSVDWQKYRDGAQEEIDQAAAAADCDRLADEMAKVDGQSGALRDYIEVKLREAGCPK